MTVAPAAQISMKWSKMDGRMDVWFNITMENYGTENMFSILDVLHVSLILGFNILSSHFFFYPLICKSPR